MSDIGRKKAKILDFMGSHPYAEEEYLALSLRFSIEDVKREMKEIIKKNYIFHDSGIPIPFYEVDYGKISKNRIYHLRFVLTFPYRMEYMIDLLSLIKSYRVIYPYSKVMSPMNGCTIRCFSSDLKKTLSIFDYLKKKKIIETYNYYIITSRTYVKEPTFWLNSKLAPEEFNLKYPEDIDIPDLSFGEYDTPLDSVDINLLMDLEIGLGFGDLEKIREEEEKRYGNKFTIEELKSSYRKLTENKIVRDRHYLIYPAQQEEVVPMALTFRCEDDDLTRKFLFSMGKDRRILQRLIYTEDEKGNLYGFAGSTITQECFLHLISNIEKIDFIKDAYVLFRAHHLKGLSRRQSISMEYFNIEDQTLYFPDNEFLESVKTKIESDKDSGELEKNLAIG